MNFISLHSRRSLSLALAILMVCSLLPFRALAAEENTPKEEVVYINLNADGTVKEINVVNIFTLAQAGTIVDYGDYEALRNMTGTSPVGYDQGTVTIQADAGKLYYEGKLASEVMPWNISVRYILDDKEYTPAQIAGMSGALKIILDITRNDNYNGNFFEAFALQASLTLDTAKCSNIVAPDATVANVGSNKQLTHTILPGAGAHLEITADVVDFTMDPIAINGIPLNLKVEVDNEALMGQVTQLLDAIAQLDNGASSLNSGIEALSNAANSELASGMDELHAGITELANGAQQLQNGGITLRDGAQTLETGASSLNDGIQALNNGIVQMQTALNTLNAASPTLVGGSNTYQTALNLLQGVINKMAISNSDLSAMAASSAEVLGGLTQLVADAQALEQRVGSAALSALGVDVNQLRGSNDAAMAQLQAALDANQGLADAMAEAGCDVSGLFGSMQQAIQALGANNAFLDNAGAYLDSISSDVSQLAYSASLMQASYAVLDSQISTLSSSLGSMTESMSLLTSAINTLVTRYQELDNGINAYTGAVAEIVTAYTEIVNGAAQLAAAAPELKAGTATLRQGSGDLLNGLAELCQGAGALQEGSIRLNAGVTELLGGIAQLHAGSSALEDGTSTVRQETAGMDSTITDKIDSMLADITGENVETCSFVSEENTNVDSVQFVIRTAGIQHEAQAQTDAGETQELTFWQKLLKLFGLLD